MSSVSVSLRGVTKRFGANTVLDDLDLTVNAGELVALLGPSGCGKTTCLRLFAGFEQPNAGSVFIGDDDVTGTSVRSRDIGIVFQAYSLFPHLNATDNVAYGLKVKGMATAQRRAEAQRLLDVVGLSPHAAKYPQQMSGGQQQRVALARALAVKPRVLLLDEPLSALDAKVRVQLRDEIRRIQQEFGTTTIIVTHDQEEALVMADRVAVMNQGRIEQFDVPANIYSRPATPFVSSFVGVVNRVPIGARSGDTFTALGCSLTAHGTVPDAPNLVALIRPEDIALTVDPSSPHQVTGSILRGSNTSLLVKVEGYADPIRVDLPTHEAAAFTAGTHVALTTRTTFAVIDTARKG